MKAAVHNPYWDTLGGGERYVASLVRLLLDHNYQVDIDWSGETIKSIYDRFGINIAEANLVDKISSSKYDLLIWVSDGSLPFSLANQTIIHFQFPFKNISGKSFSNWLKSRFYKFVVNSNFTKKFIDSEFLIKSKVIYPPVAVDQFTPTKKVTQILYVGRFSNLTQSKGQLVLIEEFKKIYKKIPGWKLVLAGGTSVGASEQELLILKQSIRGHPIKLVLNPNFSELQKLYGESTLFWSASGYGINENTTPVKVEHFGITVVEAMAAGCVPLLSRLGGHVEIVNNTLDGFLWDNPDQLGELTLKLVSSPKDIESLSLSAINRSKIFSIDNFNKQFCRLLNI